MILFNEFKREYEAIRTEIDAALRRVLDSGWYILGKEGEAFEREFADYLGVRHCVGVANGTEAIALALRGMDIGPGDEVITTDMTAFATVTGIVQAGATPVVVDIRPEDGLLDERLIEAQITPRTKCIIPRPPLRAELRHGRHPPYRTGARPEGDGGLCTSGRHDLSRP